MKKLLTAVIALLLTAALAASSCADTRVFTDSVGRAVVVDQEIERIAISGQLAQIIVFALAPQKLVGIAGAWDAGAEAYIPQEYFDLPVLGHVYGGKGDLNLETLLAAQPQIVIDVGETKEGVAQDLDELSAQTGIPFVHISASIDSMDRTYTMLGELLGMEEEAKVLADYCARVYGQCKELADRVEKKNLLYVTGEKGLNVIAKDSYHSYVIDMLSNNLAQVDSPASKGTGNEVDMEQILMWNPDVILFSQESIYDTAEQDPLWQAVSAIENDTYYEVPVGPYNWMGFPPSVQRLLGMLWMGKLLYPQEADYDVEAEIRQYFDLFYHYNITDAQIEALLRNSIGR